MPVLRTNRMPPRTLRRSSGLRPGQRNRRGSSGGNSGSMASQSSSVTRGFMANAPQTGTPNQVQSRCQHLIYSGGSKSLRRRAAFLEVDALVDFAGELFEFGVERFEHFLVNEVARHT